MVDNLCLSWLDLRPTDLSLPSPFPYFIHPKSIDHHAFLLSISYLQNQPKVLRVEIYGQRIPAHTSWSLQQLFPQTKVFTPRDQFFTSFKPLFKFKCTVKSTLSPCNSSHHLTLIFYSSSSCFVIYYFLRYRTDCFVYSW